MMDHLSLTLADREGLAWAQKQVTAHHYLHHPVDVRCRPLAYLVQYDGSPMGCLIFGRPEATNCGGWYGSVEDVAAGKCPLTRWQVLNLARVWLDPDLQRDGQCYVRNAATWAIGQALKRVGYDFLIHRPVVWMNEPYEIRDILSYCDKNKHNGMLYRVSSFQLKRPANRNGIETYVRPLRRLTHAEHAEIGMRSSLDQRARRLRSDRMVTQTALFE
jgi:hypothetical protein